jgi:hypothetical protein
MDLEGIITEVYDTANKSYPAYSTPARKDFVPNSSRNTPNFPYQRGMNDLTNPPPESIPSLPWPLGTVVNDFADSFVFLASGMTKISTCLKNNPSLSSEQKEQLIELYKMSKKALKNIRDVGLHITAVANLAGEQPSQNPVGAAESPQAESEPMKQVIKIKVK